MQSATGMCRTRGFLEGALAEPACFRGVPKVGFYLFIGIAGFFLFKKAEKKPCWIRRSLFGAYSTSSTILKIDQTPASQVPFH